MTNNNFKPTLPFIPKTETRIFLGGRPIDQQGEQSSFKGVNKQHYQSERIGEINPGYGPCLNSSCNCSPSQIDGQIQELQRKKAAAERHGNFCLEITLTDCYGNSRHATAYSVGEARRIRDDISGSQGQWRDGLGIGMNGFEPSLEARIELLGKIDGAIGSTSISRVSVVEKQKHRW